MASISNRINTFLLLLLVLMGAAIIAMLGTRAYGGPLDPSGTPASTDGVRGPGTPISSLPFTISQPGYYYVTRPLTGVAGQPGITVATSNVTIDLGGFTLIGNGMAGGAGISIGGFRNVVIRNGAIRGWNYGIDALGCGNCLVENVQASSNFGVGIAIGAQSEASNCNASLNAVGISGHSITVRNCTVSENSHQGISINLGSSLVEHNRVNVNGDAGDPSGGGVAIYDARNTVRDNQITDNIGHDVILEAGSTYNVLTGNVYCDGVDSGANNVGVGNNC